MVVEAAEVGRTEEVREARDRAEAEAAADAADAEAEAECGLERRAVTARSSNTELSNCKNKSKRDGSLQFGLFAKHKHMDQSWEKKEAKEDERRERRTPARRAIASKIDGTARYRMRARAKLLPHSAKEE